MEKLKNFLIKELTKEPQSKKPSLQDFAKRMLIGFFVLMLLLTMLSRAADSITVAKVNMALTKGGILNFKITGNGTTQAAAEKYLELYQGVKIKDIAVKVGQPVEKGDLLFTYDLEELKKVREGLQNEYTIASLNQEKGKLNVEAAAATSETETAVITIKRAELDLKLAKLELMSAQSNLDKDKNNQLKTAKDAFTSAMDTKEETEEDKAQEVQGAQREVIKAEQALQELFKDKNKAEEVLAAYKTAALSSTTKISDTVSKPVNVDNSEAVGIPGDLFYDDNEYSKSVIGISQSFQTMLQKVFTEKESKSTQSNIDPLSIVQKNIFKQYYGEETYNSHAEEVKQAQQKLIRAKEDYMLNFISIGESGGYLSTSQKAACIRAYEDANADLQKLTKKDRELSNAILAYGIAVQSNAEPDITNTYNTLFSLLYKEDEKRQKEISDARELVATSQEKLTWTTEDWDRKLSKTNRELDKAEETLSEAQKICDQIKNQTYDYSTDLKAQENQVISAERALEDAKGALKKAEKSDQALLAANRAKEQISQIDTKINDLELQKKKKAVEEIDDIINHKGQVNSPVSGILLSSDLKIGGSIAGTEKVSISTDNYSFSAKVGKDEVKHLSQGDDIGITLENGRRSVETTIESIGPEDAQGMSEITAILPEGEYGIGAAAGFTVDKKSKQYNQTIPLQAVRMDSNQVNYILVIRESNTSLGDEMIAYRVNVTVLEKDYQTAAIDAAISSEDKIIVNSSKGIEEGDRVRVNEESK